MARRDEISSTEKLLELIRSDENLGNETLETHSSPSSPIAQKLPKDIKIGIDFSDNALKFVKVGQPSERQWQLLGYQKIPIDPQIPEESTEFHDFFKTALSEFCGPAGNSELWGLMSSTGVEVRYIKIPKVNKKQIANAAYWTFKKDTPFDEKDSIFDFDILGDVVEEGVQKIACTAFAAPKQEITQLKNLFSECGFPLTGISITPFAIQNLLRSHWIESDDKTVGCLYVGQEHSRIDIFSSGNLVLTRGIKAGMNSLIEGVREGFNEAQQEKQRPFELNNEENGFRPAAPKEPISIDRDQARQILFSLSPDSPPLTRDDAGFYLKEEEIFDMVLPALERLIRQIERSFKHYSLNFENNRIDRICIMGEIDSFERLVDHISDQVGLPSDAIDPLAPGSRFLGEVSTPGSVSERASFVPALGIALSSNAYTPNFIFTYKDKEKQAGITRVNHSIVAAFLVTIAFCLSIFFWQWHVMAEKKSKILDLQERLDQYSPRVNQDFILQLAATAKHKRSVLKGYSRRYFALAVIGELSRMTPENIRLLNIESNFGPLSVTGDKDGEKTLVLEGIVFGHYHTLEASLAAYLMKLESSPVMGKPRFHKSSLESLEGKDVLHFTVQMNLA